MSRQSIVFRLRFLAFVTMLAPAVGVFTVPVARGQVVEYKPVLDATKILSAYDWLENRDYNWYAANIPLFDSPDAELNKTYYYRWELVTRHLTYGSPNTGYTYTEFIDRPFWSGRYGAISCPAGHQLYEVRWLTDPQYSRDYYRYWLETEGAQPRRYSTWLADAAWAVEQVQGQPVRLSALCDKFVKNYEGWEREHFVQEHGMFWQTGHDDGMEFNINSRQTKDKLRGAPGYRPTFNAYLYADALAIAKMAHLSDDKKTEAAFTAKAAALKENLQKNLWDPKREFFFEQYQHDETDGKNTIKALSLTYQTGQFAGNEHGRELIGYVPWQFNLPDPGYEASWKYLMDPNYFYAERGPTTTERHDPMFELTDYCCVWSGQSWPYATTQTLVAMANLLNNYDQKYVTKADYFKLLHNYALTHRKDGKPYLAEGCHPDTGSWKNYDSPNHSEHYFHSGFCDLVITGLVGLRPRDNNGRELELNPLVPDDWDYFALEHVPYNHHNLSIRWDRTGEHYGQGQGFTVFVDGKPVATSPKLARMKLDPSLLQNLGNVAPGRRGTLVNYVASNDGHYYPAVAASFAHNKSPVSNLQDGTYRYEKSPPNRWTCEGSPNKTDWCEVDFGMPRKITEIRLYLLDDGQTILAPAKYELEFWDNDHWQAIPEQRRAPEKPTGHMANRIAFDEHEVTKLRIVFTHAEGGFTGLSELEAWGPIEGDVVPLPPPPAGNLAANLTGKGFPKATASHTSRYDAVERANDGVISFRETPNNRWTSYESKTPTDWLAIDFGEKKKFSRVELYLYDDGGGVQAPASYNVQLWNGSDWQDALEQKTSPAKPIGNQKNTVTFAPAEAERVRIVFTHQGAARSGLTEIEVWKE